METRTVWNKKGDHPKVWEDYISSCGGDTDLGLYYIGPGDNSIQVFPGDTIVEKDGVFTVERATMITNNTQD